MPLRSKTTLRTARKVSPAVIRAMGEGKHFLLVSRVGAERPDQEARFLLRHLEFFLMPDLADAGKGSVRPEFASYLEEAPGADGKVIPIRYRALVTEAVMVMEGAQVDGMAPYHIWTEAVFREQVRWNPKDPAWVSICKVQRIDPPLEIPHRREYDAPGPWITLQEEELPPMAFEPVLENADYLKTVVEVKALFAGAQKNPTAQPDTPEPAAAPAGT
ncbi:MAG: DUF1802 family protein [Acidobacteriota bacterium]|jgi:hypothetical protein